VRGLQTGLHLADFKTAQRYVDALAEVGILRETSGRRRDRIYRAELVLASLR
jgi:predicted transcriptional regulator